MLSENLSELVADAVSRITQVAPDVLDNTMPENAGKTRQLLEDALKGQLEKRLKNMNLVSRDEFVAHTELLARLKQRVIALEEQLQAYQQNAE